MKSHRYVCQKSRYPKQDHWSSVSNYLLDGLLEAVLVLDAYTNKEFAEAFCIPSGMASFI